MFEVGDLTELGGVSLDMNCLIRKEEKGKRDKRIDQFLYTRQSSLPPNQHACVSFTLRNTKYVRAHPTFFFWPSRRGKKSGGTEKWGPGERGRKSRTADL